MNYSNKEHTFIQHGILSIPAVVGNRDYDEIVRQGITPAPYVEPVPTALDELIALESSMTSRRLREHLDGTEVDNWWATQTALINAKRGQL